MFFSALNVKSGGTFEKARLFCERESFNVKKLKFNFVPKVYAYFVWPAVFRKSFSVPSVEEFSAMEESEILL